MCTSGSYGRSSLAQMGHVSSVARATKLRPTPGTPLSACALASCPPRAAPPREGAVLEGASFASPGQVRQAIDRFIEAYSQTAAPFEWRKRIVAPGTLKGKYADSCK